ncbi:hypothetical protein [Parasitella parasitica]|uniref:Uncharacterized protein n=1 Tax=Parasitella parasitica TaxID=35722 RepID=A0A0B7NB49_9FUNG|nr:hypothetical protein [Parasitella parasitica]
MLLLVYLVQKGTKYGYKRPIKSGVLFYPAQTTASLPLILQGIVTQHPGRHYESISSFIQQPNIGSGGKADFVAMASGVQRKKKQEKTQNAKIDSYFKPAPKPNRSTPSVKRTLENDENTDFNDENRKKTMTPLNTQQPLKRQFGDIKSGLQPKNIQNVFRLPLRDMNPKALSDVNPKPTAISSTRQKKSAPGFAVLRDEDIEKGVEKAPTPPIKDSQESFADSQDVNSQIINSQDTDSQKARNSQGNTLDNELNTQHIPESGDTNTQWTAVTSSPIDVYRDVDSPTQETCLSVYKGEEHIDTLISSNQDRHNKQHCAGKENKSGKENQTDLTDENSQNGDRIPSDSLTKSNSNNEEEEEDDDDDNDEDIDLFGETADRSIIIKKVPLERSNTPVDFFDDYNRVEDEESTTFFDPESDEEGPFVDPGLEFSITEFDATPEESLKQTLGSYTLSQDPAESISQILVPLPNPRGRDILEKLGVEKNNANDCKSKNDEDDLRAS